MGDPRRRWEIPPSSSLRYTERYTEEYLSSLRQKGDQAADRVVAVIHNELGGGMFARMGNLLAVVRQRASEQGCTTSKEFLDEIAIVPEWARDMERGQRLLAIYAPFMGLSLLSASLVGGSQFSAMAHVVQASGSFDKDSTARVRETANIIMTMGLAPKELQPGGIAHDALVNVRLLHSALRISIPLSGMYDKADEIPINQQDLAITLSLFGHLNLRSLYMLGVRFSETDIDSFMLMWRFAGHVLGIHPDLLPLNERDQASFFHASLITQSHPESTATAVRVLDQFVEKLVPGALQRYAQVFLHQLTRYLSGNEYCSGMCIEDKGENFIPLVALRAVGRTWSFAEHHLPFFSNAMYSFNTRGIQRQLRKQLEKQKQQQAAKL